MNYEEKLSDIDDIVGRINAHPEYSGCVARQEYGALRQEAEKHSLEMELESEDEDKILNPRDRKNFLNRLQNAGTYLAENGINYHSLLKLGNLIAPGSHPYQHFRKIGGVLINAEEHSFDTPEPIRVFPQIMNFIEFIRDPDINPISKAAAAHIDFVRIHPYEDGNGRAARLIQNQVLHERSYPPAIIRADEKRNYFSLLEKVWADRVDNKSTPYDPSEHETNFYDFIASKVFESAEHVEEELKNRRYYEVSLRNVHSLGQVKLLADKLRLAGKSKGSPVNVSIDRSNGKKKSRTLRIKGGMNQHELMRSLGKFSRRYGVKFDLKVNPEKC